MTPHLALERSAAHLDDAVEYLTMEQFTWAFEDAWRGLAWALYALSGTPGQPLELGPNGTLPGRHTLRALLASRDVPQPAPGLVLSFEALWAGLAGQEQAVGDLVFGATQMLDQCAVRLGLADADVGYGGRTPSPVGPTSPPVWLRSVPRREALQMLAAGSLLSVAACVGRAPGQETSEPESAQAGPLAPTVLEAPATIRGVTPLEALNWPTSDPFLFCAAHRDEYPAGNASMGPAASLEGRLIGRDFEGRDQWRMYHGERVPGFPRHPHRGFETVTVVRTGLVDHADSMGATARYGEGDVQWLTAGGGIQHAEMFPLLRADVGNPLELFQIWLNLPASDKLVPSYFTMLWSERIPRLQVRDSAQRLSEVTIVAGTYGGLSPPPPPPNSWASRVESDLAIWKLRLEAGARFELPAVSEGTERSLYLHRGSGARICERDVPNRSRVELEGHGSVPLEAGPDEVGLLLLQGRPIGEPVARRGPFVMNTQEEIRQAYADYRESGFGGWPWPSDDPVHEPTRTRFARHLDGRFEEPA